MYCFCYYVLFCCNLGFIPIYFKYSRSLSCDWIEFVKLNDDVNIFKIRTPTVMCVKFNFVIGNDLDQVHIILLFGYI